MEITEKLISLFPDKKNNWGKICNLLQNVAEIVLPKKQFEAYVRASNEDMAVCEGCDFVTFNGEYFDWKEFDYNRDNIIRAFLKYFSESQQQEMFDWIMKQCKK